MEQAWPTVERDPELSLALRANAATLAVRVPGSLWMEEDGGHPILSRAGQSLGAVGQAGAAAGYFERLRGDALARLGPDHPDTLTTRANLAFWRGEAGDAAGAAAAFEEVLTDRLRARPRPPSHPGHAGQPRLLAGGGWGRRRRRRRLRGSPRRLPPRPRPRPPRHPAHREAGDAAGASAPIEELLDDFLRVLGPDHPHTLTTRANLACGQGEGGDAAGAAAALEELMTDQLRVLGPDHPDTLTARANLAYWQGEAGDAAGAAAAFEELLSDRLRVLGPDHPDTLRTRNHLAYWRGRAATPLAPTSDNTVYRK